MLNPDIAFLKMVIYMIRHKLTGKIYVGKTTRTLEERINEHMRNTRNSYIDRSIKRHGIENFEITILSTCNTAEELNEKEKFWIKELNSKFPNGYNLTDGGEGISGYKATPDLSRRLSEMRKGRIIPLKQRLKISAKLKGKIFLEETLDKIATAKKGHPVPQETRMKLKLANTGKKSNRVAYKRAVKCVETNTIFPSMTAAANYSGTSRQRIRRACINKYTVGGCHWEFVE